MQHLIAVKGINQVTSEVGVQVELIARVVKLVLEDIIITKRCK